MKNRAFHSGIKQSPYRAMFGIEPRVGLTTSILPSDVINNIHHEDGLQDLIKEKQAENVESKKNGEEEDEIEMLNSTLSSIALARHDAKENLKNQAKRMKLMSDAAHPSADMDDNIIIPIPDVDRAKADLRNIIGVVLEKNEQNLYKIGTKDGILNKLYCRSEFDVSSEIFLTREQVPHQEISLRTAAKKGAVGTGQGFLRCKCKTKCISGRCCCKTKGILCSSKCHNSMPCQNK